MPAAANAKSRSPEAVERAFLALFGPSPGPAAHRFIAQAITDWGPEGLPQRSSEDMARLAFELWSAAGERGEEPLIRLRADDGLDLLEVVGVGNRASGQVPDR